MQVRLPFEFRMRIRSAKIELAILSNEKNHFVPNTLASKKLHNFNLRPNH